MMNISDYNKNAQKAVSQGMETFFNWQKQALENTLTMVEEGIAVQEKNLNETRKQYQDWEQNMNRELNSQKEQYKSMVQSDRAGRKALRGKHRWYGGENPRDGWKQHRAQH